MRHSVLMSLAFVILGDVISPRDRGRYMGFFTGVFAFAAVSGPFYGGFLVDNLSWRWVFLLVLPTGLLALAVTSHALRSGAETNTPSCRHRSWAL